MNRKYFINNITGLQIMFLLLFKFIRFTNKYVWYVKTNENLYLRTIIDYVKNTIKSLKHVKHVTQTHNTKEKTFNHFLIYFPSITLMQ